MNEDRDGDNMNERDEPTGGCLPGQFLANSEGRCSTRCVNLKVAAARLLSEKYVVWKVPKVTWKFAILSSQYEHSSSSAWWKLYAKPIIDASLVYPTMTRSVTPLLSSVGLLL